MDGCRKQHSIPLNHIPPLPIRHGLEYPLGSRMHLVVVHPRLEARGATVSTSPRVPLTRERTRTQAFYPGASGSTFTRADTSWPSVGPGAGAVLQGHWSEPGQAAPGTMANVTRSHGSNR